ncbi:ribosome biogenesis GTP-binding protein YihA/YsxC [Acidobacteria bacterium AH-259-D05]|nr:ribosome biogenesis GTP-binding protein YihA/YsxC [Acidobacteria bacterium AH-259-D05]
MNVQFIKSATHKDEYPKLQLPTIAFSGRSNVGKSSLINSLLGRKRLARTSATPGRTQLINFFNVDHRWVFVDLPGYGFAKVPASIRDRWGPMIEEFLREEESLKLTVMIVDARREPTQLDLVMKKWLEELSISYQVVATKVDKLSSNQLRGSLNRIGKVFNCNVIPYSAATGMGKKELWRVLERI